MSITYYAQTANRDYWGTVWGQQQLDHLLAVAARDPLSRHLEAYLPMSGVILEGGCGLGQYVLFFRQRGYHIIGSDFSLAALQIHRQAYPDSPLLGLDLRRMPFAADAFQGHISIGVVEHVEEGPQGLLREFYRTLTAGGMLLLAVPWVNGYRLLVKSLIQRRQTRLRVAGAGFYQHAFTLGEIRAFLEKAGFRVRAFHPYSPAKGMREFPVLRNLYRRAAPHPAERKAAAPSGDKAGEEKVHGVRRLLYWPPVLWTFAHMILAVAQKPES